MRQRIDSEPTHRHGDFKLRIGRPLPYGASVVSDGVNFSIFSRHATACTLLLYEIGSATPLAQIPFPETFRIGEVYAMIVFGLDYERLEYGYKFDGEFNPRDGQRFDSEVPLLDPYARAIGGREIWGELPDRTRRFQHRGRIIRQDYDWGVDRPPNIPIEDLVIYEMHVRGFTQHPTSGVKYPGTFAAIREKIPYLKELGVNCIELMPIFEFDEFEHERVHTETGKPLLNYWGYSTIGFFAPKAGYAAAGKYGMEADELKATIKELHRNGIEVILDVVFNHTAEGNELGPTISFRGIDNKIYYMLTPDGRYLNFSGTGNTMNCNNPVVRTLVLQCLRYWVSEYHIDGFRFDLASILGRDQDGEPLANPPLLEILAHDPILANCKLIAEAWDAGGLYQVGSFPSYGRWAEWNGQYRDTLRRFMKGDPGQVSDMALRLAGSPDLYSGRGATASVNFVTAHDGFTLRDLYSYNEKHNEDNGEWNRDGANDNYSWNCGVEGETDLPEILTLRMRLSMNAMALLMVSRGVPMILMGDELRRTQHGNNNAYCQDNPISWLNWSEDDHSAQFRAFIQKCVAFRSRHPILRMAEHYDYDLEPGEFPEISWHGQRAWSPDWSHESRRLAMLVYGAGEKVVDKHFIYVAMNMHWDPADFEIPELPGNMTWHTFVDTSETAHAHAFTPGSEPVLEDQYCLRLGARAVSILVGK